MLIAHLTDIHVAREDDYEGDPAWQARVRKHSPDLYERLLADIAAQRPDHVVLTGDLTQTAKAGEFVAARALLDAHLPGVRVSALPGNHDRWNAESEENYRLSFGDLSSCDLGGEGFPYCHLAGEVAFVGLDSSPFVAGCDPAEVKGWVDPPQLRRLEKICADRPVASRFVVVLLHHHLRLSLEDSMAEDPKDPTPLQNAAEVEDALSRTNVGLVLHGHRHKQMRLDLVLGGRKVPVLCPGSATRIDARAERSARYGLYRVEGGRLCEARTRALCVRKHEMIWACA